MSRSPQPAVVRAWQLHRKKILALREVDRFGPSGIAQLTGLSRAEAKSLYGAIQAGCAWLELLEGEAPEFDDLDEELEVAGEGFQVPPPPDEWEDGLPSDLIGFLHETSPGLYESSTGSYTYNRQTDHYVTWLKCRDGLKAVAGHEHRGILAAYSNWDGKGATLNELSATFGWPRDELVEYLRVHRMTHDREPVTPEELLTQNPERALKDIEARRRGELRRKAEREKWRAEKRDAARWRNFEHDGWALVREHFDRMEKKPRPTSNVMLPAADRPYALVTSATDFHWGMYAWKGMTTRPYDRNQARALLLEHVRCLLREACLRGAPERIFLAAFSDFFHVDGVTASTTRGTPQDVDGTPQEILLTGLDLNVELVELLAEVAPVTVFGMPGNHDEANATAALWGLCAWFRNDERVTVVMDHRPRVYASYGESLLTFAHGDGMKPKDLVKVISAEARKEWGQCRWKYAFGGHLHNEWVAELGGGLKYFQLPSLAGTDRWHGHNGFNDSIPGLAGHILDREHGVISSLFSPVLADHDERVWRAA